MRRHLDHRAMLRAIELDALPSTRRPQVGTRRVAVLLLVREAGEETERGAALHERTRRDQEDEGSA